ncbi:MAG: hypothetical protein ACF8PN_05915 [Phycisphaerales bacterium]
MLKRLCLAGVVFLSAGMAHAQSHDPVTNEGARAPQPFTWEVTPDGVTEYTSRGAWENAVSSFDTIRFTEHPTGTVLGAQYIGLLFVDGNDTIAANGAFVLDGIGCNGNGRINIEFDAPQFAIGVDFPGAVTIELYSNGSLLYVSSDFAGSGTGFFAGLVSNNDFDEVVIRDWVDDFVFIDDLSYAGGLTLTIEGRCPGFNTACVTGATPRNTVYFAYGFSAGATAVPGCPGLSVDINNAKVGGSAVANASGQACITGDIPPVACGRVIVQAVELATCTKSNVVGL